MIVSELKHKAKSTPKLLDLIEKKQPQWETLQGGGMEKYPLCVCADYINTLMLKLAMFKYFLRQNMLRQQKMNLIYGFSH